MKRRRLSAWGGEMVDIRFEDRRSGVGSAARLFRLRTDLQYKIGVCLVVCAALRWSKDNF
jgi:hypothetical protein